MHNALTSIRYFSSHLKEHMVPGIPPGRFGAIVVGHDVIGISEIAWNRRQGNWQITDRTTSWTPAES